MEGGDPRCSFHWFGNSGRLYVFEAPIDLLAFLTLYSEAWREHSYVIWGKGSAKGGQKVVETAPEELKERCRQIFIPITESLEERGGLL